MAKFRWINPLSLGAMATSARTLDTLRSLHDRIDDLTISPSQRLVKTGGPWSGFSGSHLAHRLVEHEAFTLCTGTKILADDEAGGAGLRARCGHAAIIRQVYARARERRVSFSIFTEQLLSSTPGDVENRAAVKAVRNEDLKLVGLAVRAGRKLIDQIFKGGALHR